MPNDRLWGSLEAAAVCAAVDHNDSRSLVIQIQQVLNSQPAYWTLCSLQAPHAAPRARARAAEVGNLILQGQQ